MSFQRTTTSVRPREESKLESEQTRRMLTTKNSINTNGTDVKTTSKESALVTESLAPLENSLMKVIDKDKKMSSEFLWYGMRHGEDKID